MNQVDYILVSSKSSHEALKRLYNFQKQKQPTFSLTILGKKLGISSKGHISDMIRGRRSISRKHWSILSQVFDLSETQTHYFQCLLEKDHSKCNSQKSYFEKQLESLERLINKSVDHRTLPTKESPTKFAVELLKSFPIFQNKPNFRDILDYFGRHRFKEIQSTLGYLLNEDLIDVKDGFYFIKNQPAATETLLAETDYLKASIIEACDFLEHFENDSSAIFTSDVLCVSSEDYQKIIVEFRSKLEELRQRSQSGQEDTLIKVNLQVFPLGLKL